jgi:mono/diheme cytochrome c family protein
LAQFEQAGQISVFDGPIGASTTGKPNELGDFNGNGCGDLAVTGQNARGGGGQVRIVFDVCERWGSQIDLFGPDETRPPMLNIWGAVAGDMFGTELYQADFNQDGFDDLLVGAQNADFFAQGRIDSGAAYIIFGAADLAERGTLDLSYQSEGVLSIYGGHFEDRLGIWVEGGDVDGDGFPDAIISASQGDGLQSARRPNVGTVYVIYGAAEMLSLYNGVVDLAQLTAGEGLTMLIGVDSDDLFGSTVYGADLNMDGYAEVIASAAMWRGSAGVGGIAIGGGDGPRNERFNAGDTYILFGSPDLRGQIMDLQSLIGPDAAPVDKRLAVVYGESASDIMGEEIVVGDLNGDGLNDLIVGSLAAPGLNGERPDGGEAWVIYNDGAMEGRLYDLAAPGVGVPIYAAEGDSKGGDTLLVADMDQDGIGDLIYGMPNADAIQADNEVRQNTGVLAILYGTTEGFPTTDGIIDFAALPDDLRVDFWLGADDFDMSAYGLSVLDVDQDGYPDLSLNGMNGDGPDNKRPDSGEVYIVSGAVFAQAGTARVALAVNQAPLHTLGDPRAALLEEIATAPALSLDVADFTPNLLVGQELYTLNCAGCHGAEGQGIAGIAAPLVGSPYLDPSIATDAQLWAFIRVGRTADSPYSKLGRPMPASGGNPSLTDSDLLNIIAYIRTLE